MDREKKQLLRFMAVNDQRFIIPIYQRSYDWDIENCAQLFDDLVKIIKLERDSHFFGSIVGKNTSDGRHENYLIIDGQQRLTTVSLLLLALYKLLNRQILSSADETIQPKIFEEFLVNRFQKKDSWFKLRLNKSDQKAYQSLFSDDPEIVLGYNITNNFNYFYNRIQELEVSADELYEALWKLEVIDIWLSEKDNAQLIFESLNSTGLALSEGDKIRNYILMDLPMKQQEEYYEKYWNKIESFTGRNLSMFVRAYLSIKNERIPPQSRIYIEFKNYVDSSHVEIEQLLADMLEYANRYRVLLKGKTADSALNGSIYRLNRLESTVTHPFLLEVLRYLDEKKLSIQEVSEVFRMVENYIFRRIICEIPTNSLNKTFLQLNREIIRLDGTVNQYVDKLKYIFRTKKERERFPQDQEFKHSFENKLVYQMNSKNRIYLLERLENDGTVEDKDVYRHVDAGDYSIEHIMPQHLTEEWKQELGDDYEKVHEIWLHRAANLTLTGYNSSYSNRSFQEKKKTKNGFEDSGIRMNSWIAKQDKWTESELEERSDLLANRAQEIWYYPVTKYEPQSEQNEPYHLDEEIPLDCEPEIYRLLQKKRKVSNWDDLYVQVVQQLYAADPTILQKLASSGLSDLGANFNTDPSVFKKSEKIADGIYIRTDNELQKKISVITNLLSKYDMDPSDLTIYFKNKKENTIFGANPSYYSHYWDFALPVVQRKAGSYSPFKNVNSRSNYGWINGFSGISGFYFCLVATSQEVRVEFVFSKKDKTANKKAFDALFAHKDDIEQELGRPLTWIRNDDAISSKVCIVKRGLNIKKEKDWLEMADFHAEWGRKFSETIRPLVLQNNESSKRH
ncbi:DUF4268 domain-containing protein [Ileibacterium valens]|uniref:DUF4268 domain-containing protein n=1 Tax=Ileibacterium valens TaxID=1862668 RepID=UPI00272C2503|nr:DUF4268 domain-containing protein [Ileibacterium valens]